MKKVISLPSSPAALRRFSPSSSHSPSSSSTRSSAHNKTTSPALRRPSPNSHHHKSFNRKNANNNKKKLSLSIKLAASSDSEWGRTDDEGDDDSTTWGSSDEDEWESSFDPSWVVDADELELHRRWTDQNGITTAGQPAGVAKGKPLRRSPLATNSTVSQPASEHHSTPQHLDVGAGACADVSTSRPPSPSSTATVTATGHQISYAQLQSAANAASSAAARHSPSSSPRKTVDAAAGSLLPALDLDRVVSSPVSLGSSMSRRNTIATPREARGDGSSSSATAVVSQWKVGKISPRSDDDDVKSEATAAQKNESEEATTAKLSPRRSELQISFERFEARLALKKQQSEVFGVKTPEPSEQPQHDQGKTVNSKRSSSKRKMKKNVRSLNKEETDAKRKKKRSEVELRRTYRRSQGSPPMLLRSAAAAVESDSSEVAGYLAECGGSETESEEEKRAKASSAPVSPHSSSSSSLSSLAVIASLALRSGSGFPLSRSRSSEVQAKARRTITKEDKKRDDANNVAVGATSTDHLPAIVTAAPLPPNNNINKASSNNTHDSSAADNAELTWKTIWQDPHEGQTEGAVTLTSSSLSSIPPLTSSLSANEASTRKLLKRGLEGRSASLPPAPSLSPIAPPSSPSLPPHIEPLPFPPFATSPPASLNPLASPPAPAPSSVVASPSLRHRRRAESSSALQQLMLVTPPLLPHGHPKQQLLHHHPHRSLERVRTVVLSPSLAARQQQRQAGLSVASPGCSSRGAAESGEINTSSFLRSQSEDISARAFDDFDCGDDDSGGVYQLDDGLHERRQVASWRGRSGGEWRNRSRESGFHHQSDDLATRRARIERARSFGGAKTDADHCDSSDDDLLLFVSDDDDDSVFVDDEANVGEEEEHMIEAELTSFLKRTRSGSHKPLRDFSGPLEGRRSPLTVRLLPHHHHHHHASMTPTTRDDEGGNEPTITDGGLESGESHTGGGASRDSGHELPCRSPWGITLE